MKKLLLTLCGVAFIISTHAQDAKSIKKEKSLPKDVKANEQVQATRTMSGVAPIWSDDFGTAANWVISNGAGNSDNWVIGTAGPAGSFAIPAIASPTAANGFALFDSDFLCSGNQNAYLTTANPINLSGQPNVVLNFYQQYRRFWDSSYVQISTNGTTWANVPFGNLTIANSAFAGTNPNLTSINISSIAGNEDSVWIRFNFYSVPSMNANAGCGYAWMIDDVSITNANDNEIVLDALKISSTGRYDIYGTYKTSELAGDSVVLQANFTNAGNLAQPNTRMTLNVYDNSGSPVASQNFAYGTVASGGVDSIVSAAIPLNLFGQGTYTLVAGVISDSAEVNIENNYDTAYFDVADSLSSMAIRTPRRTSSLGTNSFPTFSGAEDDFRCANILEMFNQDTVTGVYMNFTLVTEGALVVAHIRDANDMSVIEMESDLHVITATDTLNRFLWLPMLGSIADRTLAPGDYFVSVSLYSNINVNHIRIADDLSNEKFKLTGSSLIFTADDQTWYNNGIAFDIDATFGDMNVSVRDMENANFNYKAVYPNPADQHAQVAFSLKRNSAVSIQLRDMQGRVIQQHDLGTMFEGEHVHSLELSGMRAGLYFVELIADGYSAAQKLVIK